MAPAMTALVLWTFLLPFFSPTPAQGKRYIGIYPRSGDVLSLPQKDSVSTARQNVREELFGSETTAARRPRLPYSQRWREIRDRIRMAGEEPTRAEACWQSAETIDTLSVGLLTDEWIHAEHVVITCGTYVLLPCSWSPCSTAWPQLWNNTAPQWLRCLPLPTASNKVGCSSAEFMALPGICTTVEARTVLSLASLGEALCTIKCGARARKTRQKSGLGRIYAFTSFSFSNLVVFTQSTSLSVIFWRCTVKCI